MWFDRRFPLDYEMSCTLSSFMEGFVTFSFVRDVSCNLAIVIAFSKLRFAPSSSSFSDFP